MTFAELLEELQYDTPLDVPPETHSRGLGVIVWELWVILRSGTSQAQISAAKELIDRSHGRPGQAAQDIPSTLDALYGHLALDRLTRQEAEQLRDLLDKVDPDL